MKQVLIKQGHAIVEDVPAPQLEPGTVLVAVDHSCISIGTEMSGVRASAQPLWKRALQQPQNIQRVANLAFTRGLTYARRMVQGKLDEGQLTGYSAAGRVIAVGEGTDSFKVGDRVACTGTQFSHHAEIIRVPLNLVTPIPAQLGFPAASTVALGAISLQGVRRAQPTIGETFVVIGLGVVGQLTAQILKACGCRTIGTDLDRRRIQLAMDLGMDAGLHPDDGLSVQQVEHFTGGRGADGVIITAASPSHQIAATAFQMCRRKGRVVLVGDVGLNLNRADLYSKELDFLISTSYGPGRYDRNYEEQGLDYPLAYVRWTENRNMEAYLQLLAAGKVAIGPLLSQVYPVEQAGVAYDTIQRSQERSLMVLLSYAPPSEAQNLGQLVKNRAARPAKKGQISVALVGAGGFARGVHLPNLQLLDKQFHLRAVVSRSGHTAVVAAKQFGAEYATTDFQRVLEDEEVDALIIATRHHLHADMALAGLKAGKAVLVEKPLALTKEELARLEHHYASFPDSSSAPLLMTGFNRRFSPFIRRLGELTANRTDPMLLNYRMNAGYLPLDHWVHTAEGGGRNRGEACHIYDLFLCLTGSQVVKVQGQAIVPTSGYYSSRDNFVVTLSFADGSVASLTYTALGAPGYPKEQLDVFVDGKVITLNDYKRLQVSGTRERGMESKIGEKGHREELVAFGETLREGKEWPIPLWQQLQSTAVSFEVERILNNTDSHQVGEPRAQQP